MAIAFPGGHALDAPRKQRHSGSWHPQGQPTTDRGIRRNRHRWRCGRKTMDTLAERLAPRLALTLSGSSLAYADSCPCGCGGQCPCWGCGNDCTNCALGGGCSSSCTSGGNWNCCVNGCVMNCAECCCGGTACHCFIFIGQSCGSPNCPSLPVGVMPEAQHVPRAAAYVETRRL